MDGFDNHPIMGPITRAMELQAYMEDLAYKRERRQMERDDYKRDLEDREWKRRSEDVNTVLLMHKLGAPQIQEGAYGTMQAGISGRTPVDTRAGRFALPSDEQQIEREASLKQKEKDLEPKQRLLIPEELRSSFPFFGPGYVDVPKDEGMSTALKMNTVLNPPLQVRESTDAAGNVTRSYINPRKGTTVSTESIPGIGKPSRTAGARKLTQAEMNNQARAGVINDNYGGQMFIENPDIKKAAEQRVQQGLSRNVEEAEWFIRNKPGQASLSPSLKHLYKAGKLIDKLNVTKLPEFQQEYEKRRSGLKASSEQPASGVAAQGSAATSQATQAAPGVRTKADGFDASWLADWARQNKMLDRQGRPDITAARKHIIGQGWKINEDK